MAFAMSFLMSLVMTYVSIGLVSDFLIIWLKSFVIGLIVSFPIALFITPIAAKIVKMVVKIAQMPPEKDSIGTKF